jgi:hypothetical protein
MAFIDTATLLFQSLSICCCLLWVVSFLTLIKRLLNASVSSALSVHFQHISQIFYFSIITINPFEFWIAGEI